MVSASLSDRLMDYFESHQGKQKKVTSGAGMNPDYEIALTYQSHDMKSVCLVMKYLKITLKAASSVIKIILPSGTVLEAIAYAFQIGKFNGT